MMNHFLARFSMVLFTALLSTLLADAQRGAKGGEWRFYGGDSGSTKYSALDQINRDNVKDLKIAWRWKTDNFGPSPEFLYEATPLMVNGVLYTTAGYRRAVAAIDAATGETLWIYRMDEGERGLKAPRRNSGRGVAYWTDGTEELIFLITPGFQLVALDAKRGIPRADFGHKGIVDLKEGLDRDVDPVEGAIGSSSPPIISHDVVVVGAALEGGFTPKSKENVPGHIRGYDVRTGKRLWIFHTIAQPGEFGNDTWEDDSWSYTGNTGAWAPLSVDEELGYVYLPVEDATGDFYGGHRLGDNLFSASLVCLDVKTGKRIWHYQLSHHDIWDYDPPAAPILADITVGGRPIQAVVQLTKQAFAFVFDRVSGKPVWPIEERPVPQSDVPGERTSPTQPFPTRPKPFDLQGLTVDDLIDFTPELRAEAIKIVSQYRFGPLYTPPSLKENPDGTKGTISLPATGGGANWDSGAVDIETGVLYVTSFVKPVLVPLVTSPNSDMNFVLGPGVLNGPQGLPLTKPPWGRITAIDLNSGEHLWMVPNGETPEEVKNHPSLKGLDIGKTGKPVRGGILVTKSLLFVGTSEPRALYGDPVLQAFDKQTGERIAAIELPAIPTGVPMAYMLNSKQYLVVAVGGPSHPGELVALSLSSSTEKGEKLSGPPAVPRVSLRPDTGKELVEARCTLCHDLERAVSMKRPPEEWERIVKEMVNIGMKASPEEIQAILSYLQSQFG
ncbi:MAG: PQQ-binding-like beta-propeller repeat protein [Acidobacteria bacterium]|nr:PQQ-binding-like beta-propeller repeat protein [Acidobacteriota bacterium]